MLTRDGYVFCVEREGKKLLEVGHKVIVFVDFMNKTSCLYIVCVKTPDFMQIYRQAIL